VYAVEARQVKVLFQELMDVIVREHDIVALTCYGRQRIERRERDACCGVEHWLLASRILKGKLRR